MPSDDPSLSALGEHQWRTEILRYCMMRVRTEVAAQTFEVFREYALEGKSAEAVAVHHGIRISQVYVAKHRVLCRIRELIVMLSDDTLVEVA